MSTRFNVTLSNNQREIVLKNQKNVGLRLSDLVDVDRSIGLADGSTIVYNASRNIYVQRSVFDVNPVTGTITIDGGGEGGF
jgi:hypothetical protein